MYFFEMKTGRPKTTRGHDFALVKGQTRLDVRKYSFSHMTVNERNKSPADGVHYSGNNMFKAKLLEISSDTHQLKLIKLSNFKLERF